jgi:metal-responsive CopG/Arc/MetJ family transcriptional regulator
MNDRITIRLDPDIVEALERVVAEGQLGCRSRQDAFRYAVRTWLTESGYLEDPDAGDAPSERTA